MAYLPEANISYIFSSTIYIIAYQNKKHTFNWLNTLHVTFITSLLYRLGCWYRPVQKPWIDWCYWSIHSFWTSLYQHIQLQFLLGFLIPWNISVHLYCVCQILIFNARNTIVT